MTTQFTKAYTIPTYDCDLADRLKISALFNYFQDSCETFANHDGFGCQALKPKGLTWMIHDYDIRVNTLPHRHDNIVVDMHIDRMHHFRGLFIFNIHDKDRHVQLVESACQYLLVNPIEMKMADIKENLPNIPVQKEDKIVFERLPDVSTEKTPDTIRRISYEHIDFNQHVNNSYYPVFAQESLPRSLFEGYDIQRIRVSYKSPATLHERIAVYSDIPDKMAIHSQTISTHHKITYATDKRTELARIQFDWMRANREHT